MKIKFFGNVKYACLKEQQENFNWDKIKLDQLKDAYDDHGMTMKISRLACKVLESTKTDDFVKFIDIAIKISSEQEFEIDRADLDKLKNIFSTADIPSIYKYNLTAHVREQEELNCSA